MNNTTKLCLTLIIITFIFQFFYFLGQPTSIYYTHQVKIPNFDSGSNFDFINIDEIGHIIFVDNFLIVVVVCFLLIIWLLMSD